jgi:hypothetical protein
VAAEFADRKVDDKFLKKKSGLRKRVRHLKLEAAGIAQFV